MKIGKYTVSQIRKTVVAGVGLVAVLATSFIEEFTGLIPDDWAKPVTWVISTLTAVGVFLTKNAPLIDAADEL